MSSQLPKRPEQHQVADESKRFFADCLPRGWTQEERINDYGVDLQIGIARDNYVTGEELLVQLKSTSNPETNGDSVAITLAVSTLNYLRNMLPVVLLVKYVAPEKEGYWLLLKDFTEIPAEGQQTVTIRLPRANRLSQNPWEKISAHVAAVHHKKLAANRKEFEGPPLGPGLGSAALVSNGVIHYDQSNVQVRAILDMQHTIREGRLSRDANGRIVAVLHTTVPSRALQTLNEQLKLDVLELVCSDPEISVDLANPSRFVLSSMAIHIDAGESVLNISTWQEIVLPFPVDATTSADAVGCYDPQTYRFSGEFAMRITYRGIVAQDVFLSGKFDIQLQ